MTRADNSLHVNTYIPQGEKKQEGNIFTNDLVKNQEKLSRFKTKKNKKQLAILFNWYNVHGSFNLNKISGIIISYFHHQLEVRIYIKLAFVYVFVYLITT